MFVGISTNNVLGSVLKIQKPSLGEAVSAQVTANTAKDDNILTAIECTECHEEIPGRRVALGLCEWQEMLQAG